MDLICFTSLTLYVPFVCCFFFSLIHFTSNLTFTLTLCVCFCCRQMTAVVMADSFAAGTRQPQRGWSSLGGSCRRSMNSCAASMARTPHIRRCYRYAHTTARAHTLDSNRQLLLQQIKLMPELGWTDIFCWHHLKSWLQHSVHADVWFRMCCNNADSCCCLTTSGFSSAHEKAQMTLYSKLCPLIHKQPLWEQKSLWKNNRNLMGMITVWPRSLSVVAVC